MKFDTQVFLVLGILFVGALTAFSFLALDKIVPSILLELLTAYFVSPTILMLVNSFLNQVIEFVAEVQSDLSSLYADITETSAMQRIVYDLILIALGLIKILLNLAILELILVVHFYISIYQLYQSIKAIFVSLVAVDRYARSFWNEMSLVCSSKY
ncbi:hypothetical protein VI817_008176 [Penicillium citrinum]|nr:hypothetical protein VI817_008176 [Penicillium citrinum]